MDDFERWIASGASKAARAAEDLMRIKMKMEEEEKTGEEQPPISMKSMLKQTKIFKTKEELNEYKVEEEENKELAEVMFIIQTEITGEKKG